MSALTAAPGGASPVARGGRLGRWVAGHRRGVLYGAFTLAVFCIALAYSLPHDLIARRIVGDATAAAPVDVAFREVGLAFPNGYRFRGLTLTGKTLPELRVGIDELTVRAPIGNLLTGARAAAFAGELLGGEVAGTVAERGAGAAVELHVEDLDLAQASAALLLPPPAQVAGRATIDLDLAGDGRSTRSSRGEVRLDVRGLALTKLVVQGITVPDLAFAEVRGRAKIEGTTLQIQELQAEGPDGDVGISGSIVIREPVEQSVLNLELRAEVAPDAQPAVRMAVGLLPPKPTGQPKRWTVRGTLTRPTVK
jgi:type II secretion system protein N